MGIAFFKNMKHCFKSINIKSTCISKCCIKDAEIDVDIQHHKHKKKKKDHDKKDHDTEQKEVVNQAD